MLARRDSARALAGMRTRGWNYDPARRGELEWHVDDLRQPLPPEPPGPPLASGSWAMARRLLRGYEFADPSIVRAFYDPGEQLEGRTMLLELRFHGLSFRVGVRVAGVYDDERTVDRRRVRVWGWGYRTLEGHLEMGQMDWQVWKWLDTGDVEFRIHAYSRRARDRGRLVRLGFRLFGRREQLAFLESTRQRMAALTEAALRDGTGAATHAVGERLLARRARDTAAVHDELGRQARAGQDPTCGEQGPSTGRGRPP